MIEPAIADFVLIAVLAVGMPLLSAFYTLPRIRALPREEIERARPQLYGQAVFTQWLFAAAALHVVFFRDTPAATIGLAPEFGAGFFGALGLVVVFAALVLWQRRKLLTDPEGHLFVRQALERVEFLLPRTPGQRRAWWIVSAHAGWGEELFYRGYLFALLAFWMPVWAAAVVSTLMFGLAHVYQGVRGIVLTSLLGVAFAGLYLLSGSLLLPILAHALYDVHAGELGYWAYGRDPVRDNEPGRNDQ